MDRYIGALGPPQAVVALRPAVNGIGQVVVARLCGGDSGGYKRLLMAQRGYDDGTL